MSDDSDSKTHFDETTQGEISIARVIESKIAIDAEYKGILIDSTRKIFLYEDGYLQSGYLKADASVDGMIFKADTLISFYSNGVVSSGFLKINTPREGFAFKGGTEISFFATRGVSSGTVVANTTHKNLTFQKDVIVGFSTPGVISLVRPMDNLTVTILEFSVFEANLLFDAKTDTYRIYSGKITAARLIASLPTALVSGEALKFETVIAAPYSSFTLYSINPENARGDDRYDVWRCEGKLSLNAQYFGYNANLSIRGMTLVKIRLTEDVVIDSVIGQVKAGTVLRFNNLGKAYITPP